MLKSILIVNYLVCVLLASFGVFGQITFSKDWRPSGKRSLTSLMNDDYGNHLRSALGYTKLAEVHLQSLMAFPRRPERSSQFKPDGGLDDALMPFFAPSEDEKIH